MYLPYWQNKRKVKYIDTEEFYQDLLTYCQTDINSKSSVIIKKLENKYKTKRLKDETIKRIHMSYRDILSGRKINKRSIKLILNNELVASLEKHDVDVRVIKSICQYQLLRTYKPKNKNNTREKHINQNTRKKEEISNQFYFDLSLLVKEQIELLKLDTDTRILHFNKRVKNFVQTYPNELSEKSMRNILRAYRLNLRKVNDQHEPLLFIEMLEKELIYCGVNKKVRTLILNVEQELYKRKEQATKKKHSEVSKPKREITNKHKVINKKISKKPAMTKEYYTRVTDMVRDEAEKAIDDTHVLNHSWITKELSRDYNTSSLEKNMVFLVVAYQYYVYELEKDLTNNIEEKLLILQTNLMDCGVEESFYKGILDAERSHLEKKENELLKQHCQQINETKEFTYNVVESNISQQVSVDDKLLEKYYKDLSRLLIKAYCYEKQDIIKALKRKYKQDILDESELILLIDTYKYMTEPLSNIQDDSKRLQ